jgi:hypothetical protein
VSRKAEPLRDIVTLAKGAGEWTRAIEAALACENDWSAVGERLDGWLKGLR